MSESYRMKETDKDYYVLVNHKELLDAALSKGYENVTFFQGLDVTSEMKDQARETRKSIVRIYFTDSNPIKGSFWMKDIDYDDLPRFIGNVLFELNGAQIGEKRISTLEEAEKYFPTIDMMERILKEEGLIMEKDYKNRCGNCHEKLEKGDKYCRYCGTPRGEGNFEPYRNEMLLVYGPPVKTMYTCNECGYSWSTVVFGGDNAEYCPKCGHKISKKTEL